MTAQHMNEFSKLVGATKIYTGGSAFAALVSGSVVSWGNSNLGGDSSAVSRDAGLPALVRLEVDLGPALASSIEFRPGDLIGLRTLNRTRDVRAVLREAHK